jgi:hypothetical protein
MVLHSWCHRDSPIRRKLIRPPQGYPPLPPMADTDDDAPPLNTPVLQGHPLPSVGLAPQANEPPAGAWTRNSQLIPRRQVARGTSRCSGREATSGGCRNSPSIPPGPAGWAEPDAVRQDAMRPRLSISPGRIGPGSVDSGVTIDARRRPAQYGGA